MRGSLLIEKCHMNEFNKSVNEKYSIKRNKTFNYSKQVKKKIFNKIKKIKLKSFSTKNLILKNIFSKRIFFTEMNLEFCIYNNLIKK